MNETTYIATRVKLMGLGERTVICRTASLDHMAMKLQASPRELRGAKHNVHPDETFNQFCAKADTIYYEDGKKWSEYKA